MDVLSEFLSIKDKKYLTGTYYARRPITASDSGESFEYEAINTHSQEYRTILNSILADNVVMGIKTVASLPFKIKGYVATQDGEFWQITAIQKAIQSAETEEALRIFREAETETVLSLIQVDNPFELK